MKSGNSEIDESELFEYARGELENNSLNETIWQKAMALSGQMEANAREKYISMRVAQLKRNVSLEAQYAEKKKSEKRNKSAISELSDIPEQNVILNIKNDEKKRRPLYLIAAGILLLTITVVVWSLFLRDDKINIPEAENNPLQENSHIPDNFAAYSAIEDSNESVVKEELWKLSVLAEPLDASVQILNIKAPYEEKMSLAGGKYHIKVFKKGYDSKYVWLDLNRDMNYSVILSPETFSLNVQTFPEDAIVQIINIKPVYYDEIRLRRGKYRIRVSKKGYKTIEKTIALQTNTVKKFTLEAENDTGKLPYYLSDSKLKFSDAFPACLDRDMRLPSREELERIMSSNKIVGHVNAWFWTSERSGAVSYNVIQNSPERLTKKARLSEEYFAYCIR